MLGADPDDVTGEGRPGPEVLDLFAVTGDVEPLSGGTGGSVRAGDLALSPGRDAGTAEWLNPTLAVLAADLDTTLRRGPRDLRIAMPIPARDGSWVIDGWGATRFEPGATPCTDLDVLVATGRLLHAHLATRVPHRPPGLDVRVDRWAKAARIAFCEDRLDDLGDLPHMRGAPRQDRDAASRLLTELVVLRTDADMGPDQLVHADLAGNVLLDEGGSALVIDVSPAWRPALWAEAVCVLDAVMWAEAPAAAMRPWTGGAPAQAMIRAAIFRLLSGAAADAPRFRTALGLGEGQDRAGVTDRAVRPRADRADGGDPADPRRRPAP